MASSSPKVTHSQGLQGPRGRDGARQSLLPPPSGLSWGWDQSGVCRGRPGHRRGRGRAGGNVSRQAPRWLPVSGPLHEGRGQDETCPRPPLKVTAAPGPLLSLCLGASPGPMPKPRPARGPPGGRAKSPVDGRGGTPVRNQAFTPEPGRLWATPVGRGTGRVRKPTPSLQSSPPGTHASVWWSEVATVWGQAVRT